MSRQQPEVRPAPANPWAEYERLKADWIRRHPGASSSEYEQAMREIARRLGL